MNAHAHFPISSRLERQQGVTLIVALIFLIVLTLFVTAGARTTMMQERMSGYSWEQNLAFQSAEYALRQGEVAVASANLIPSDLRSDCQGGLCASGFLPDWDDEGTWTSSAAVTTSMPDAWTRLSPPLAQPPKYYVEYAGSGKAVGTSGNKVDYYRVMARGVGRVASSQSVLISTFRP